jgi:hypothetical protein
MTVTDIYAGSRRILDADSHVKELPGWLAEFADARTRELLRPLAVLRLIAARLIGPRPRLSG